MVTAKVVLNPSSAIFQVYALFCPVFFIGNSPILKRVVNLILKTGSTPIYRYLKLVNIGLLFRRTEDECLQEQTRNIWKVEKAFINLLQAGLDSYGRL